MAGAFGRLPRPGVGRGLEEAGRDQPRARRLVIPRQHPVVDAEDDVRYAQVFVAGRREMFVDASPVVREVTGGASLERRKLRQRAGGKRREQRPQRIQRVAAGDRRAVALHVRALAADDGHRISGQKGIPAEPRAPRGAVEKQAVRQIAELFTAADRVRQRDQFLDQRHEAAIAVHGSGHPFRVFRRSRAACAPAWRAR